MPTNLTPLDPSAFSLATRLAGEAARAADADESPDPIRMTEGLSPGPGAGDPGGRTVAGGAGRRSEAGDHATGAPRGGRGRQGRDHVQLHPPPDRGRRGPVGPRSALPPDASLPSPDRATPCTST